MQFVDLHTIRRLASYCMPSPRRIEKLNLLLQEEVAKILDREVEVPEGTMLTVTRVGISSDGHYAAVFVSLLGTSPKKALENIKKNVYTVQQALNRRVKMRPVPKIHFEVDEGEFQREKVERSLAKLKQEGGM